MKDADTLQLKSPRLKEENGRLFYGEREVSPFMYSLLDVPWQLFWTMHYKGPHYAADTTFAEKNRRHEITNVLRETQRRLGLRFQSLYWFGGTEKKGGRCHTHTLIGIDSREGEIANLVRETIWSLIPWDIMTVTEDDTREEALGFIRDQEDACGYLSKMNNGMEIQPNHWSVGFSRLVARYQALRTAA